jgi:predicted RNA-binding protein
MCLAAAYIGQDDSQPILKDIAHIKFSGKTVELETLFGENKVIQGKVQEIDFVNSKIIIKQ